MILSRTHPSALRPLIRTVILVGAWALLLVSSEAAVASVSFMPDTVVGGATATGTVTLDAPASASGATIALASNIPAMKVPATIAVPPGQTSATFVAATAPVADQTAAIVTASLDGSSKTGALTLMPVSLTSLAVNSPSVLQGTVAEVTITLNGPAPKEGTVVTLMSTAKEAPVPASVKIPPGQLSAILKIATKAVDNPVTSTITASLGFIDSTATLTINPIGPATVTLNPPSINGKGTSVGTVTLYGPAAAPMVIQLGGSSRTASFPSSVKIEAGQSSATFPIVSVPVTVTQPITVSAKYGSVFRTTMLNVLAPAVASTVFNPPAIIGGGTSEATVTLSFGAPPSGTKVEISCDMPTAKFPDVLLIPAGKTTGTFKVITEPIPAAKPANVKTIINGAGPTTPLTVQPPVLKSFVLGPPPAKPKPEKAPTQPAGTPPGTVPPPPAAPPAGTQPAATVPPVTPTIIGTNSIEGTISFGTASPVDGIDVVLTSSDKCAIIPPRATIAGGRTSVTIKVRTTKVKAETPVTLTATWNGVSVTATLKVK